MNCWYIALSKNFDTTGNKAVDNDLYVAAVLMDISKAFDSRA
jgi:hypothetical protein